MMDFCEHCGKTAEECNLIINVFGNLLCDDCWDKYINLSTGRVEYFVNLANGEEDLEDYDPETLKLFVAAWEKYKSELPMSEQEIQELETAARNVGLLD